MTNCRRSKGSESELTESSSSSLKEMLRFEVRGWKNLSQTPNPKQACYSLNHVQKTGLTAAQYLKI
jgi:hypothetical protein